MVIIMARMMTINILVLIKALAEAVALSHCVQPQRRSGALRATAPMAVTCSFVCHSPDRCQQLLFVSQP